MNKLTKNKLLNLCVLINEEAKLTIDSKEDLVVVIVGGSALILSELTRRITTHDVDVLSSSFELNKILSKHHAINKRVGIFYNCIPYNFEDRLVKLNTDTDFVKFFTLSQEDLAVMKLYSWRDNDIEDLYSDKFLEKLNWELLDKLIFDKDEAQATALNKKNYNQLVSVYLSYAKDNGHEPNI